MNKKIKSIVFILTTFTLIFFKPPFIFAVNKNNIACDPMLGPIAEFVCALTKDDATNPTNPVGEKINSVVGGVITLLISIAGVWFIFQFIIAGYNWINAGGDKTAAETARQKIMNAVVGLIVIIAAWTIVGLLGTILGVKLLNPGLFIIGLGL